MAYSIATATPVVSEGAGTVTFTVTRDTADLPDTVYVSTAPVLGFANSGDYTGLLNLQIAFAAGETQKTVSISLADDSVVEGNETFGIIVQQLASDPVDVFLAKSSFTIADNDGAAAATYAVSPDAVTVNENAGTLTFTISRTAAAAAETVYVSTTPNQGFANQGDYAGLLDRAVSFAAGQTTQTVSIAIKDDGVAETDERFGLIVQRATSDPVSTWLAKSVFTIHDDDQAAAPYAIAPGSTTVDETAGTMSFTVTRTGTSAAETLYVSTTPNLGFANQGDYAGLLDRAISFAAGESSQTVTIAIKDDAVAEADESFGLVLQRATTDPVSTYLAKAVFTIRDNDTAAGPVALGLYPATGVTDIGQGNRDNDDSHTPGSARQWAYDFLAPKGTEVHAVAGGTVVAIKQDLTGSFRGNGNVVTILHDGGFYASYGHLTANSSTLSVGQRVTAGDVIALSGDSGSYDDGYPHPNLHIQFGTKTSLQLAVSGKSGSAVQMADGSGDAVAPAFFPKLTIHFDKRADPGLSTDTDYYGTQGVDDFYGNGSGNAVFGGGGDDILRGNGGSDTLRGGLGADRLTGGSGNDIFLFAAPGEAGDTITDFSSPGDSFQFKGSAFGLSATGTLAATDFASNATGLAQDASDRFIFDTSDRTLWFDADGTGASAPILIAHLQSGATLTYADILII